MTWLSIIIAGTLTYFTRMTMIALVSRDMLGDRIKAVLVYVPSAVFPAIIFPAIFINDYGTFIEMNDPKIFGAIVAIVVGYFSKNVIATILSGLISYLVVDQGFAESNKFFKKNKTEQHLHFHLIGTGSTLWVCWQISTLAGIILGSFVPEELGLKFAIPLTFIAIIVQDLKKIDHVIVMIVCGISSLLFFDAPFKSYIIISPIVALITAALILRLKK